MKDSEIVFTVVVIVAAYWYFCVRGKPVNQRSLKGRQSTGRSGTVGGGASKVPTTHRNTNPRTNAQQGGGTGFSAAPIAQVGTGNGGPGSSNVGGRQRGGLRSSMTNGLVGSFVSNAWPTRRVTSTGSQRINTGITQVPSYTAVPLSTQGPGGGGSLVH
jgi:hypothetical protein